MTIGGTSFQTGNSRVLCCVLQPKSLDAPSLKQSNTPGLSLAISLCNKTNFQVKLIIVNQNPYLTEDVQYDSFSSMLTWTVSTKLAAKKGVTTTRPRLKKKSLILLNAKVKEKYHPKYDIRRSAIDQED